MPLTHFPGVTYIIKMWSSHPLVHESLQRAYPTDNLLGKKYELLELRLKKITDVGTRWRESWSITNEMSYLNRIEFIIQETQFTNSTAQWQSHVLSVKQIIIKQSMIYENAIKFGSCGQR
jgi:hypothetical protein